MHERKLDVLEGAIKVVCGKRHEDYGSALDNHTRIADFWNVWVTEMPLTAYDVAMMMALVKVARCMNRPTTDSHIDLAGYAALAEEIHKETMEVENGRSNESPSSNDGAK